MTGRVTFRLHLSPEPDALARALGVVLVAQAGIVAVSYVSGPDRGWSSMDLEGLGGMRADALVRRLLALPCVRDLQRLA